MLIEYINMYDFLKGENMFKLIFQNTKKREWLAVLAVLIFIVGQVFLDLKLPDYMQEITVMINSGTATTSAVLKSGGFMLLCAVSSALLSVCVGYIVARLSATVSARIRSKVFNKVLSFSHGEINKFSTASLITRSTNDVAQIQGFIAMGMQASIKAPILAVWAICKIANKSWQWSTATAVAVGFLLIVVVTSLALALPRFKKIQTLTDNLNRVTRENLTGVRVVRAYNAENYEEQKFEKANNDITQNHLFTQRVMAVMSPAMSMLMSGLSLAIYWIGAHLINEAPLVSKSVLMGDMVVFMSYSVQVIMAFIMLVMIFVMTPRSMVAGKRINEVLDTKSSILDGEGNIVPEPNKTGEVEFKHVCFKYPNADEYVLKDITFTAKKGETVAIIGSTGCGKSTLVNLVPRFYDITEGSLTVDGVNVKDYKLADLHNKIGYVSQKAVMFSGTVESNISLGDYIKEPTKEDMMTAIDTAQASDFIKTEDDLNKPITQGGLNVSGGQKQRLSIARALLRAPEILIFDDTFSALDYKTDKKLRKAISQKLKDSTCLIVAQRIGTIKNADKIIVLEDGEIAGMGKHDQLLKTCKVYQEIALSQLSKEEL